tara:strand:+ start:15296 stop:21220 length:5925 start_codon:yes stop_codon:yes gene_type:complete
MPNVTTYNNTFPEIDGILWMYDYDDYEIGLGNVNPIDDSEVPQYLGTDTQYYHANSKGQATNIEWSETSLQAVDIEQIFNMSSNQAGCAIRTKELYFTGQDVNKSTKSIYSNKNLATNVSTQVFDNMELIEEVDLDVVEVKIIDTPVQIKQVEPIKKYTICHKGQTQFDTQTHWSSSVCKIIENVRGSTTGPGGAYSVKIAWKEYGSRDFYIINNIPGSPFYGTAMSTYIENSSIQDAPRCSVPLEMGPDPNPHTGNPDAYDLGNVHYNAIPTMIWDATGNQDNQGDYRVSLYDPSSPTPLPSLYHPTRETYFEDICPVMQADTSSDGGSYSFWGLGWYFNGRKYPDNLGSSAAWWRYRPDRHNPLYGRATKEGTIWHDDENEVSVAYGGGYASSFDGLINCFRMRMNISDVITFINNGPEDSTLLAQGGIGLKASHNVKFLADVRIAQTHWSTQNTERQFESSAGLQWTNYGKANNFWEYPFNLIQFPDKGIPAGWIPGSIAESGSSNNDSDSKVSLYVTFKKDTNNLDSITGYHNESGVHAAPYRANCLAMQNTFLVHRGGFFHRDTQWETLYDSEGNKTHKWGRETSWGGNHNPQTYITQAQQYGDPDGNLPQWFYAMKGGNYNEDLFGSNHLFPFIFTIGKLGGYTSRFGDGEDVIKTWGDKYMIGPTFNTHHREFIWDPSQVGLKASERDPEMKRMIILNGGTNTGVYDDSGGINMNNNKIVNEKGEHLDGRVKQINTDTSELERYKYNHPASTQPASSYDVGLWANQNEDGSTYGGTSSKPIAAGAILAKKAGDDLSQDGSYIGNVLYSHTNYGKYADDWGPRCVVPLAFINNYQGNQHADPGHRYLDSYGGTGGPPEGQYDTGAHYSYPNEPDAMHWDNLDTHYQDPNDNLPDWNSTANGVPAWGSSWLRKVSGNIPPGAEYLMSSNDYTPAGLPGATVGWRVYANKHQGEVVELGTNVGFMGNIVWIGVEGCDWASKVVGNQYHETHNPDAVAYETFLNFKCWVDGYRIVDAGTVTSTKSRDVSEGESTINNNDDWEWTCRHDDQAQLERYVGLVTICYPARSFDYQADWGGSVQGWPDDIAVQAGGSVTAGGLTFEGVNGITSEPLLFWDKASDANSNQHQFIRYANSTVAAHPTLNAPTSAEDMNLRHVYSYQAPMMEGNGTFLDLREDFKVYLEDEWVEGGTDYLGRDFIHWGFFRNESKSYLKSDLTLGNSGIARPKGRGRFQIVQRDCAGGLFTRSVKNNKRNSTNFMKKMNLKVYPIASADQTARQTDYHKLKIQRSKCYSPRWQVIGSTAGNFTNTSLSMNWLLSDYYGGGIHINNSTSSHAELGSAHYVYPTKVCWTKPILTQSSNLLNYIYSYWTSNAGMFGAEWFASVQGGSGLASMTDTSAGGFAWMNVQPETLWSPDAYYFAKAFLQTGDGKAAMGYQGTYEGTGINAGVQMSPFGDNPEVVQLLDDTNRLPGSRDPRHMIPQNYRWYPKSLIEQFPDSFTMSHALYDNGWAGDGLGANAMGWGAQDDSPIQTSSYQWALSNEQAAIIGPLAHFTQNLIFDMNYDRVRYYYMYGLFQNRFQEHSLADSEPGYEGTSWSLISNVDSSGYDAYEIIIDLSNRMKGGSHIDPSLLFDLVIIRDTQFPPDTGQPNNPGSDEDYMSGHWHIRCASNIAKPSSTASDESLWEWSDSVMGANTGRMNQDALLPYLTEADIDLYDRAIHKIRVYPDSSDPHFDGTQVPQKVGHSYNIGPRWLVKIQIKKSWIDNDVPVGGSVNLQPLRVCINQVGVVLGDKELTYYHCDNQTWDRQNLEQGVQTPEYLYGNSPVRRGTVKADNRAPVIVPPEWLPPQDQVAGQNSIMNLATRVRYHFRAATISSTRARWSTHVDSVLGYIDYDNPSRKAGLVSQVQSTSPAEYPYFNNTLDIFREDSQYSDIGVDTHQGFIYENPYLPPYVIILVDDTENQITDEGGNLLWQ